MKNIYLTSKIKFNFIFGFVLLLNLGFSQDCGDAISTAHFDLNSCLANLSDSSNEDYSEFTASIMNSSDCASIEIAGGFLYRQNPESNQHSCTPGVEGSDAMCVSIDEECTYDAGSEKSIRIDIVITPGPDGTAQFSGLNFYEQSIPEFIWIGGASGENNYPTLYGIRVLSNGTEIYSQSDIATNDTWTLQEFDFSSNTAFTVTETTEFNIELLAYCPIGNGAPIAVWDIDELTILSDCTENVEGGTLSTENGETEITICAGDGNSDAFDVNLSGNEGDNSAWVITDADANILALPPGPPFDLEGAGEGVCLIWHLSFADGLTGAEEGNNAADLMGCFDLSNPITVTRNGVNGGELATIDGETEITICAGDGNSDAFDVNLSGNEGANSAWVITDADANILALPPGPPFDLEGAGEGVCLIWHLSFADGLTGAEEGNNAADLMGCFDLSNPITVIRNGVNGGELATADGETEISICAGDGVSDAFDVTLAGNEGDNAAWVITDADLNILALPPGPPFDLEGAGAGVCLIWHLSFADGLTGAEEGSNAGDLDGCFSLSNPITVNRTGVAGGELATVDGETTLDICAGDGISDAFDVTLSGNEGDNSAWVITDADLNILALPPGPPFDLEGAGGGVCLIWHLSFADGLTGAEEGSNAGDLDGCFSLSNPITVNRTGVAGGELATVDGETTLDICAGDGISDAFDVTLAGNEGDNSAWVITDADLNILALPPGPPFDLEGAGAGVCLIWHLSFADGLLGAEEGSNAADLEGCFSLSNPITVNRTGVAGGTLATADGETELTICAGDGESDAFEVTIVDNEGTNTAWVITDADLNILALPPGPPFDLEGAGEGVCLVWHLSFEDGLSGAVEGGNAADLEGCFALSNPITVTRLTGDDCNDACPADGGSISLEDGTDELTICAGDGNSDAFGVALMNNVGANSAWVITDADGTILDLPTGPPFDLEGAGEGVCLIWHLSFEDGLMGAVVGNNASDLMGCFDLSNPITVIRNGVAGGELATADGETEISICAGDGISDAFDVSLSGNAGEISAWVITDADGNILDLPTGPPFDLEGAGEGVCLIWHLSFVDGLMGAVVGNNASDLDGCFALSNPITVNRSGVAGGNLTTADNETEISICAGDGVSDAFDVLLTDNVGTNSAWVITDADGNILDLPAGPPFDLEGAGGGVCLIWHLSFADGLMGAEVGNNASELDGCFSLSNPITVNRTGVNGGVLSTTSGESTITICDGNGDQDAFDILLTDTIGESYTWIVTDADANILELPSGPPFLLEDIDLDTCYLWNLSSYGSVTGLEVGGNAANIDAFCFDLSNPLIIAKTFVDGGSITIDGEVTAEVCVDDGVADDLNVILENEIGENSTWITTSTNLTILDILDGPPFDFEGTDAGVCLLWHISYSGTVDGLEVGANVANLTGCFNASNQLTINKLTGANCPMLFSEIVINEINTNGEVELKNIGNATQDISSYWLCNFPAYTFLEFADIVCGDLLLSPGEIVTVNPNISIVGSDGEMGLYFDDSFSDPNSIMDYVEWGSTGHQRSSVAVSAGIWTTGDFVSTFIPGNSLEYDGDGDSSTDWAEDAASPCEENFSNADDNSVSITLFPNPTNGNISLSLLHENKAEMMSDITIYDIYGKVVKRFSQKSIVDNISLDTSELQTGRYIIRFDMDYSSRTKSFIVIK